MAKGKMSSIKDQIITLVKQRHHSHKVALEQEKDPRSKHAIDLIARIREDSRLIEVIDSLSDNDFLDESIIASKELEEEIQKTIDKYPLNKEDMSEDDIATYHQGIIFAARHFAEWGARHSINWGDVQLLDTFILELSREEKDGADWGDSEKFYTEVLRRFHEFNDKKIPEIVAEWGAKHLK